MSNLIGEFLKRIHKSSSIAIGVADLDGNMIEANDAWCELIGYSRKELLTVQYFDFTPPEFHVIDEQAVNLMLNNDRAVEYEKEVIHKDGTRIPILLNSVCIRNENNEPIALAGTAQRITRYKSYQNELKDYENKLEIQSDITNEVVCELDINYRYLSISPNSKCHLSYRPSELLNKCFMDYIHSDDQFIIKSILDHSLRNYSAARFSFRFRSKDNEWLLRDCAIKPYKISSGETRFILNFTGITDAAELKNKLFEQNRELRKLDEDLEQRVRDLEILCRVAKKVHQSLDLEETYQFALDIVYNLENVDMVFLYVVDTKSDEAVLVAHRNVPEIYIKKASIIPKGVGLTWKIINNGKTINIEDVQTNTDIGPAGKELGHHGVLGIPLKLDNKVIGVIYVDCFRHHKFDDNEVKLLASITDHLSVAISKAKLYEDLSIKNTNEQIITSITESIHKTLNLNTVLRNTTKTIYENIENADNVAIFTVTEHRCQIQSYAGCSDVNEIFTSEFDSQKSSLMRQLKRQKKPIIMVNTEDADKELDFIKHSAANKSFIAIPIYRGNYIFAIINILSYRPYAFDDDMFTFFTIISRQIQSAVNNAILTEELKESEKKFRELYENVPTGIYRKSKSGEILLANSTLINILGFSSLEDMVSTYHLHKDFLGKYKSDHSNIKLIDKYNVITELESVWHKKDGSPITVLESVRAVKDKNDNFLYYEGTVTDISKRKKVEKKLQESKESLRKLTEHLEFYREKERTEVAREIHDDFAQLLTGMAVDVSWLKKRFTRILEADEDSEINHLEIMDKLENFTILINDAFETVKNICARLRPSVLDELGIEAAIKWQIDNIKSQTNIDFLFDFCINGDLLNTNVKTALFRIFQESISNILRHAEASKVEVRLQSNGNNIILRVNDNGKGMDEETICSMDSLGLLGMTERTKALNGDIDIKSEIDKGTSVTVSIPFRSEVLIESTNC